MKVPIEIIKLMIIAVMNKIDEIPSVPLSDSVVGICSRNSLAFRSIMVTKHKMKVKSAKIAPIYARVGTENHLMKKPGRFGMMIFPVLSK